MKAKQELKTQPVQEVQGIPICGANFETPVLDNSRFLTEIHYRIGNKLYIENAD